MNFPHLPNHDAPKDKKFWETLPPPLWHYRRPNRWKLWSLMAFLTILAFVGWVF